jgi:hypothetical protein
MFIDFFRDLGLHLKSGQRNNLWFKGRFRSRALSNRGFVLEKFFFFFCVDPEMEEMETPPDQLTSLCQTLNEIQKELDYFNQIGESFRKVKIPVSTKKKLNLEIASKTAERKLFFKNAITEYQDLLHRTDSLLSLSQEIKPKKENLTYSMENEALQIPNEKADKDHPETLAGKKKRDFINLLSTGVPTIPLSTKSSVFLQNYREIQEIEFEHKHICDSPLESYLDWFYSRGIVQWNEILESTQKYRTSCENLLIQVIRINNSLSLPSPKLREVRGEFLYDNLLSLQEMSTTEFEITWKSVVSRLQKLFLQWLTPAIAEAQGNMNELIPVLKCAQSFGFGDLKGINFVPKTSQ